MELPRKCNVASSLELSRVGEEMKLYKILFVSWVVALFAFNANALTCATDDTVYYIHYSCGNGTLADGQTLPEPTPVRYNQTVTPQLIKSQCVGPDYGFYKWAGYQIVAPSHGVNQWGEEVPIVADVLSKTAQSFVYKYTHDIVVQPRWVDSLGDGRELVYGGMEYSATNGVRGEWEFIGWGGYTYGVSMCVPIRAPEGVSLPYNTGATHIATPEFAGTYYVNMYGASWPGDEIADTGLEEYLADAQTDWQEDADLQTMFPSGTIVCACHQNLCSTSYRRGWVQMQVYKTVDACSAECATTCGKSMMDAVNGLHIRRAITAQCRVEA